MSIAVMSAIWNHSPRKGGELLVLLALADFATDYGMCYPSIGRLATKTRLSERQVRSILRTLEEAGEIATEQQEGPKGCNVYRILPPKKLPPEEIAPGNLEQGGRKPTSPEPSLDPSLGISTKSPPSRTREDAIPQAARERWQADNPELDIPAFVADYLNWSGSSKHRDKVRGFESQLRIRWKREQFTRPEFAERRNGNGRPRHTNQHGNADDEDPIAKRIRLDRERAGQPGLHALRE